LRSSDERILDWAKHLAEFGNVERDRRYKIPMAGTAYVVAPTMKYSTRLSALLATVTVTAVLAPNCVTAQVINQGIPAAGYSSTTTYYVPFTGSSSSNSVTTQFGGNTGYGTNPIPNSNGIYYGIGSSPTSGIPVYQNIYPGTNLFPNSNDGYYGGYERPGYARPSVIIQKNSPYPPAIGSTCSTSIVGSPIASPVAIDRFTGLPCR
jgi:hypothetical protein